MRKLVVGLLFLVFASAGFSIKAHATSDKIYVNDLLEMGFEVVGTLPYSDQFVGGYVYLVGIDPNTGKKALWTCRLSIHDRDKGCVPVRPK